MVKSRHLRRRRPRVLLGFKPERAYRQRMCEGIIDYVREHQTWELIPEPGTLDMDRWLQGSHDADGVLGEGEPFATAALHPQRWPGPVVMLCGPAWGRPAVVQDNAGIVRMALEHLVSRGHSRVTVTTQPWGATPLERRELFLAQAPQMGLEVVAPLETEPLRQAALAFRMPECIRQWALSLPRPTGVFATADDAAAMLVNICGSAGIRVPDDLAVVGVNDDEILCNLTTPPISSVDHGMRGVGYEAAALLDRILRGEPPPANPIVVPPRCVVPRQSTDVLAVEDPWVRQAIHFIRRNACEGIRVAEVLREVPLCRRTLETAFRKLLGHSVHQEILQVRLDQACRLLRETAWPTPDVAAHTGFASAAVLSETFRRVLNTTPTAYRRERAGR